MERVGIGFDVHRLAPGRRLVLAHVPVEFDRGPLGHSDGDVVLHAVIDALLGAAGLPDIGEMFPDNDPRFKDADSGGLLGIEPRCVNVKAKTGEGLAPIGTGEAIASTAIAGLRRVAK